MERLREDLPEGEYRRALGLLDRISQQNHEYGVENQVLRLSLALERDYADRLLKVIAKINDHGCCVMHNDSGCPGCVAAEALRWPRPKLEKK